MLDLWRRIQAGGGTPDDIDTLEDVAARIAGKKTLCALGDFAAGPVWSAIQHFRPEFEDYLRRRTPARERERELVAV
jgi:NADH-quinone oxidoreductase subunit F